MAYELKTSESYAGFWIRFVASLVDSILVSIVIGPIAAALYEKPDATASLLEAAQTGDYMELGLVFVESMRPAGVGDFVLNVVVPAAAVVLFWVYRSATPGKMVTRTRIVDASTGGAPSTRQCVVRYLGYFVSMFGLFIGFFWVAFDRKKQGWHDKLANTLVVRDAAAAA